MLRAATGEAEEEEELVSNSKVLLLLERAPALFPPRPTLKAVVVATVVEPAEGPLCWSRPTYPLLRCLASKSLHCLFAFQRGRAGP